MLRIGFVMFPGCSVLNLSAIAVFEVANIMVPKPVYDLRLLSEAGGPIRTSAGMMVGTEAFNGVQLYLQAQLPATRLAIAAVSAWSNQSSPHRAPPESTVKFRKRHN